MKPIFIDTWGLNLSLPEQGFPISLESLLLASALREIPFRQALDLGCGAGFLACALAVMRPEAHVTGMEIHPDLAALALHNAEQNNLQDRIAIINGDINQDSGHYASGAFELVVMNPPFRKPEAGRVSPCQEKAVSCAEGSASLLHFFRAAEQALTPSGLLALVHLPERLPEVFRLLHALRLPPRLLQTVHHDSCREASSVLLLASRINHSLRILPPHFVTAGLGGFPAWPADSPPAR